MSSSYTGAARLVWRDTAHYSTPVDKWLTCKVSHDKYAGTITLTLPWDSEIVATHIAGNDWEQLIGHYLDVYYRDFSAPLLTGALIGLDYGWGYGRADVTLTYEALFQHVWRQCIMQEPTNDKYYSASLAAVAPDLIGQRIMNDGLGIAYASGGYFTTAPVESSSTVKRGDGQQFLPWTITVPALHSPALSASTIRIEMPSGGNMAEFLFDLGERGDIAYTIAQTSAGTYECDTTGTYQRNNVSATVVLSDTRGTMLAFGRKLDWAALRNTWLLKGDGTGTAQSKAWYQDANAIAIGRLEDTATLPDVTAAAALDAMRDRQMGRYSEAADTVSVEILEQGGVLFNSTFGLRDLVTVRCDAMGYNDTHVVVGYELDIPSNGVARVGLTLGQHVRRYTRDVADWVPGPGGRGGGGLFTVRAG